MPDSRSILSITPKSYTPQVATFDDNDFSREIKAHGRVVEVESALRCPCYLRNSGSHNTSCQNCFGSGWIFRNRRKTVALIQSINQTNSKFKQYDIALSGHMNVTMLPQDRLSYMDVIRMTEHTIYHSELIEIRKGSDNVFYAITSFEPIEIDQMLVFKSETDPLVKLTKGVNFEVVRNKIVLTTVPQEITPDPLQYEVDGFVDVTISIRYTHHPTWHIFESLRVFSADIIEGCDSKMRDQLLPTHYVAVLPNRLVDAPKYNGNQRIDNSDQATPPNNAFFGTETI